MTEELNCEDSITCGNEYLEKLRRNQPHSQISPTAHPVVTVLTSVVSQSSPEVAPSLNKRYYIDENTGKLALRNYQNAAFFKAEDKPVSNIVELAALLTEISPDNRKMIIRGLQVRNDGRSKRRKKENFAEHPDGTYFVMLDFDKINTEFDPITVEAIESVIAKLPPEFTDVSYCYQHSNSAGIHNENRQPLKQGLNAHVFFWLNRRVRGEDLTAYLKKHCLDTGFYTVGEDKGGSVRVWYGVDTSTIYSAVQPHFTASPTLGNGVQCNLKPEERQGLVTKKSNVVTISQLAESTSTEVYVMADEVKRQYEKAHGYVHKQLQTVTRTGIASSTYSINPNAVVQGNRDLKNRKLSRDGQYLTLYFVGENSPGSWFVSQKNPQFAKRFGDGERIPLKELSQDAYNYIRDELKWFTELPHHTLPLLNGYLPEISSFAKARVSLMLAPTGCGKTKAAIDWMKCKWRAGELVIYTAPTIALVNQMQEDVRAAAIPCSNYRNVFAGNLVAEGVIVTTNASLRRILGLVYEAKIFHYIVYDEIHAGFDEFMLSNKGNDFFEKSILKAKQTLLLTGTLTEVQKSGLPNVIGYALSCLTEENYCCYEFNSVKSNPLVFRQLKNFDADFVELIEDLAEKARRGVSLPRVVILLSTSKLDAYRNILSILGLDSYAYVVSRPETHQSDIDAARMSNRPILIASPLFGVGINLYVEPEILWARFDKLNADTNHVIQTVNRANRGQVVCDVRIYANTSSESKIKTTDRNKLKQEISERLGNESSLVGLLEEHLQIDRNTYLFLRALEKDSDRTLSYLREHNLVQNYNVVEDVVELTSTYEHAEKFKEFSKHARDSYNSAIYQQAQKFTQAEIDLCFWNLNRLSEERKSAYLTLNPRVERDIETEELGVVMALCSLQTPQQARMVKIKKIQRIFAELQPWVSAQFAPEHSANWAKVQAEKTECMVVLLKKLAAIKSGSLTVSELVATLSRNKKFCEAFTALALYDQDYLTIAKELDVYIQGCKATRIAGSDHAREELRRAGLKLLKGFLEPIAVFFERKVVKGKTLINYDKLIVPEKWDLAGMANNLTKQALRLKALPVSQKVAVLTVDEGSIRKTMDKATCEQCVMYHQMECVLGHPVDCFDALLPRSRKTSCSDFKVLKIKLVA